MDRIVSILLQCKAKVETIVCGISGCFSELLWILLYECVIVTNKRDTVLHADITASFIADHDLITTTIDISKPKRAVTMRTLRHIGAYSKDALCKAILDHKPELINIYHTDDIDIQLNIVTTVFTRCLNKCALVKH